MSVDPSWQTTVVFFKCVELEKQHTQYTCVASYCNIF